MSQLPTPPLSREASEEPISDSGAATTTDQKLVELDALLERYLHLLDRHQKLHVELGKKLSSGFLALSHANYCAAPGRRYGQDYYDERMKATRRTVIAKHTPCKNDSEAPETWNSLDGIQFQTKNESTLPPEDESDGDETSSSDTETKKTKDKDDQSNPVDGNGSGKDESTETVSETQDENKRNRSGRRRKPFRSEDPLSWFGILVPPSLRNAKQSFSDAVNDTIPQLASVALEMRVVEGLVGDLRKEINGEPATPGT